MRHRGRQLYLKLYLAFLGVLLVVAGLGVGISLLLGRGALELWHRGPRVAMHVARSLPELGRVAELQRALDQAYEELGFDVTVLDEHGAGVAHAGTPVLLPPEARPPRPDHLADWIAPGLVAVPLHRRDGPHGGGLLLMRLPPPPGAAIHVLPLRPLLMLVGALLAAAALLFPLSRSITRPLERLTAAAEAFGRGDLTARSGLAAEDEVGRLAKSFDEMADRIQATRKAEKELLANVSHELRTPLQRMKIGLELIDARQDAATTSRLASIGAEIDELDGLVAEVLTASRLELAEVPLRKQPLRIAELLEKSRARAQALSPAQPIEVRSEPALQLSADEALISRALDNLIENARKYAGDTTQPIQVEARGENGSVLLSVRDHGPGFLPGELGRVFDPFFRGESARGGRSTGYGLGLAIARRVAEAHGGSIRATNAEGGGARLELRLPA